MKRLSSLSAMAAMLSLLAPNFDGFTFMERPRSPGSRRGKKHKQPKGRGHYMPHIGAKEQERAARCYMSSTFNCSGNPRCSPVMHQLSKHGA